MTVARNGITTTLPYNDLSQVAGELYSGGSLGGLSSTRGFDSLLRQNSATTSVGGSRTFTYDNASRLQSVSDGTYSATYAYLANSPMVGQITFKENSTVRLTTTKSYDYLNRLQSVSSGAAGSFAYQYNDANQRVRVTLADGSYWMYEYDSLGQVKRAKGYWIDHVPVAGQQFEYGFDDIGNRTSGKAGGDSVGTNLRNATYAPNLLNQYSSRSVPGAADVLGLANVGASVSVNSQTTYRKSEYYHLALGIGNGSGPAYPSVTVSAVNGGSSSQVTGNVFLPQSTESFGHDLDGNLTSDGRWSYIWDGENRLVVMVANTAVGPQQRIEFEYDYQGRRIGKKVWNNTAGTGSPALSLKFLYDGWNVIAELDGSNSLVRSYFWGLDLSGSVQGAGGVGGLVGVKPNGGVVHFVVHDGNGNVVGLVEGSNGTVSANYEYGPLWGTHPHDRHYGQGQSVPMVHEIHR